MILSVALSFLLRRRRAAWIVAVLTVAASAAGAPPIAKEYEIKAAFLYNFTKFIEWPADRFADEQAPIVIAVVGRNPFGDTLADIVRDRTVNGRGIVFRTVGTPEEAAGGHLIFLAAGTAAPADDWLAAREEAGAVVVGEITAGARTPGAIVFVLIGDKVRFEIDQAAAERARVKVSAQLLKLAARVRKGGAP